MDSKKKIVIIVSSVLVVVAIAIGLIIIFLNRSSQAAKVGKFFTGPAVFIETPDKFDKKDRSEFELGIFVTELGKDVYPAASFSISFDPNKMEFLGLEEGSVLIADSDAPSGENVPEWSVDVETCNKTGLINVMYLDISGKDKGFTQDKLSEDDNSLFYLKFKLRGTVKEKDIIDIAFKDACFACEDDSKSLTMLNKKLKTKDSFVMIADSKSK